MLLITVFHHWIISTTQYLTLLLIRKTLNLIPTSTGRSDVLKNRQRGNGEQCTFKLQYKFNMHFFIYKCYVRFHMYICSKSLYSQLQLSQSLKSACPFVQPIWPNYSNISLHTVCSSYPPLGNCFKTKRSDPSHLFLDPPKNWPWVQKWVFIKYAPVIYHWEAHGKEVSKSQNICLPYPP